MNPFYSFKIYMILNQDWIQYFNDYKLIEYPITKHELMENSFHTNCIIAATELEMVSFYGCLDSKI